MPPIFQQYPDLYNWVIFPLLIFISRMGDVSLGTLRAVLAAKGRKTVVPFIGFIEVLLWLFAMSQIMQNLNNFMCYFAWAAGYAMGSFLGLTIEEKLALGLQGIRIITSQRSERLMDALREAQLGFTIFDGEGARGPVKMIYTIVERKEVVKIAALIKEHHPSAFFSVEDIKNASQSSYRPVDKKFQFFTSILPVRKGK